MPSLKHLHTYERSKKNKRVYRCIHPDCTSFARIDDLRGKRARCRCGREFILPEIINEKAFKRKTLVCEFCYAGGKYAPAEKVASSIIDELLNRPVQVPVSLSEFDLNEELDNTNELEVEEDD